MPVPLLFRFGPLLSVLRDFFPIHGLIVPLEEMARKKTPKSTPRDTRSSYMFPNLHQDVSNAVSDAISSPWFKNTDTDSGSSDRYSTFVMGRFQCDHGACSNTGWGSKKVAILIRSFGRNGYNAVVFGQRCQSCKHFGILRLDESSYTDRVAYRLKKWAGVATDVQHYSGKTGPPHMSELCEGCKRGYCLRKYNGEYLLAQTNMNGRGLKHSLF